MTLVKLNAPSIRDVIPINEWGLVQMSGSGGDLPTENGLAKQTTEIFNNRCDIHPDQDPIKTQKNIVTEYLPQNPDFLELV